MTKFSNKLKKPLFQVHFGPIFPVLGAKKIFPENPALSRTTSLGILAPCQNLEKIKDTTHRRMEGRMEGRTDPILQGPSGYCRGFNNKDSRMTPRDVFLVFLLLTLNRLHTIFSCIHFCFEEINAGWVQTRKFQGIY